MEKATSVQELLTLAKDGGVETLNKYLSQTGSDINSTDSNMKTALILAIEDGHGLAVQSLIAAGIDVNRKCVAGNTALMCCARLGNLSYLRMLIEAGSLINDTNNDGETALMFAAQGQAERCNTQCVQLLLQAGANVNIVKNTGETALFFAIGKGHVDCVEYLTDAGADVSMMEFTSGDTALIRAIDFKQIQCVKLLLSSQQDVNKQNNYGWTALMMASVRDRSDLVRSLIKRGANVNLHNNKMETALMIAAREGHLYCVRELIQVRACLDAVDIYGQTALTHACRPIHRPACVQELLFAGANPSLPESEYLKSADEDVALIQVIRLGNSDSVTDLLKFGAEINARDIHGDTALIVAVKEEKCLCLKTLVDSGADVNLQNKNGQTALMIASSKTFSSCFLILKDKSNDLNICDNDGMTTLMYSRSSYFTSCLLNDGANINHPDNKGNTALMECCRVANVDILQVLIQYGADINLANVEGKTAPMFAALNGYTDLAPGGVDVSSRDKIEVFVNESKECTEGIKHSNESSNLTSHYRTMNMLTSAKTEFINCLSKLIDSGADINLVDSDGRNALYFAAVNKRVSNLSILLSAGGDVQWRDSAGKTLLMHAMSICEHGPSMEVTHPENTISGCVRVLLQAGTDVNAQDKDGRTALMFAAEKICRSEHVQLLIAAGADANLTDKYGRTALMITAGVDRFCKVYTSQDDRRSDSIVCQLIPVTDDIDRQDNNKNTALLIASANQFVLGAIRLIESGASVNVRDLTGMTPLMHATIHVNNSDDGLDELRSLLIQKGADVNAQDIGGMTPLMYAARDHYVEVCNQLLSNGANVDQTDNKGRMALMHLVIASQGRYDLCEIMSNLLKNTTNFLVMEEFRPLLQTLIPAFHVYTFYSNPIIVQFFLCNGVTDFNQLRGWNIPNYLYPSSPFAESLTFDEPQGFHRFLLANIIVFQTDFDILQDDHFRHHKISEKCRDFVQEALSNPWPLVKLCFIVVSSKIGDSPRRAERIRQTGLPRNIQECLLFQRPIANLPVHHWQDIPLTFNPTEYELLPTPYPLLYNWPFGRRLVTCYCSECKGRRLNFETS